MEILLVALKSLLLFLIGASIGYLGVVLWDNVIKPSNEWYWIKTQLSKLSKPSAHTVYYVILNEFVSSTSEKDILSKLIKRYGLKESNARLLIEIARVGEKEWFEEAYLTRDGIYSTSSTINN